MDAFDVLDKVGRFFGFLRVERHPKDVTDQAMSQELLTGNRSKVSVIESIGAEEVENWGGDDGSGMAAGGMISFCGDGEREGEGGEEGRGDVVD